MTESLLQQCLALSHNDRKHLICELEKSLNDRLKVAEKRFKIFLRAATELVGKGILTPCRNREVVIGRMMIIHQMRAEGFSFPNISMLMKRTHSSAYHLAMKMQDVIEFSHIYREEYEYWTKFQTLLKEYEEEVRGKVV